ncbi:TVP38/TMEM64 family inner membrane protein YdjZ [Thermoflexales bacterium]|nr:TVP38/TMEM64 family inner membrane protein YdjZ [Thermoflexales bacterium]
MKKRWGVLVILIILAVGSFAIGGAPLIRFLADQERVRAWIEGFGVWGPLALIAMIAVQTVLSVSPISLLAVVGAYLFGFWQGVVYAFIGLALGSSLCMILGRRFGRPLVDRLIDPKSMATFDRFTEKRGPVFFFIIFVMPWVPDDLACYAIGLSRLSLKLMIPLAAFGRMPSVIVQCWLTAYATVLPPAVIIGVIAGGVLLALAFYRYHRQLEQVVIDLAARFNRRVALPVTEPVDDIEG